MYEHVHTVLIRMYMRAYARAKNVAYNIIIMCSISCKNIYYYLYSVIIIMLFGSYNFVHIYVECIAGFGQSLA